jgi:spoIIIJ-associated protein
MESLKKEIEQFLNAMGVSAELEIDEAYLDSTPRFNIRVDDASFLIGGGGRTLASLELVLKKIIQKRFSDAGNFIIDVNDYRLRHAEELKSLVRQVAKRVRIYRKEIRLKPMSAFERKIIHTALAEHPDITTESIGVDPDRKVVIKPFP